MLVVGVILVVVALVVVGFMIFGDTNVQAVEVDLGVFTVHLTPLQLFGLGAGVLLVLVLGVWISILGFRRQRARNQELKDLRHLAESRGGGPDRVVRERPAGPEQSTPPERARPAAEPRAAHSPRERPAASTPAPENGGAADREVGTPQDRGDRGRPRDPFDRPPRPGE